MSKVHYVIVTHGMLAKGFADTIQLLTQKNDIHAVTAYIDDGFPENLSSLIKVFHEQDEVVVFTDLTCGSVTQKVIELYGSNEHIHVFASVNLSLILEMILYNEVPSEESINMIIEQAREQMCYLHK